MKSQNFDQTAIHSPRLNHQIQNEFCLIGGSTEKLAP